MDKHTKGPWRFVNGQVPRIINIDGKSICGLHKIGVYKKGKYDPEELEANGRILSSSLEMLEALKQCRELAAKGSKFAGDLTREVIEQGLEEIDSLIEKVEGTNGQRS